MTPRVKTIVVNASIWTGEVQVQRFLNSHAGHIGHNLIASASTV